ncbi:MAG: hypothetical protein KA474_03515 [Acinetobacter sp.]|nr:hypothetical protein [Acinetobacter sp.]
MLISFLGVRKKNN